MKVSGAGQLTPRSASPGRWSSLAGVCCAPQPLRQHGACGAGSGETTRSCGLVTIVVTSQQSEIAFMQQLLEQRGAAIPLPLESLPEQHELVS